jgi:hypothetical protein
MTRHALTAIRVELAGRGLTSRFNGRDRHWLGAGCPGWARRNRLRCDGGCLAGSAVRAVRVGRANLSSRDDRDYQNHDDRAKPA